MKKKIIAITLATALCVGSLMGCGNSKTPANESDSAEVSADTDAPDQDDTTEDDSDEDEQQASTTASLPHYECKQEVLDADPGDGLVQIADMVFRIDSSLSVDDVKNIVSASDTGLVCIDSSDNDGYPTVEIQDSKGNEALHLIWSYYNKEAPNDAEKGESGNYLTYVGLVKYDHDWVDFNSYYLAGGVPYNFRSNDESVDMSSFSYTKDEYIELLKSKGFVPEDELENKLQYVNHYNEKNGFSIEVFYPSTQWKDSTIYNYKYIMYVYEWDMNGLLCATDIYFDTHWDEDTFNEIMYGETN